MISRCAVTSGSTELVEHDGARRRRALVERQDVPRDLRYRHRRDRLSAVLDEPTGPRRADGSRPGRLAQLRGGVLGRDVPLGLGQQLVADHELAHVLAQQRRQDVRVQLPVVGRRRPERRLVPAHGVGERSLEEGVVAPEQPAQDRGQRVAPSGLQVRQPRRPGASGRMSVSYGQAAQ